MSSAEEAFDRDPGVETSAAPESEGLNPTSSEVEGTLRYLATSMFTGSIPPSPLSCDFALPTVVEAFSHLKAAFTFVHFDTFDVFICTSEVLLDAL